MGLSFIYAAGPCQRSVSRVLVPWDFRPYFTVSHLRHPFSSPPTTRRVTVEVFDPTSTRGCLTPDHRLSYKPLVGQWSTRLVSLLRCHRVYRLPSKAARVVYCSIATNVLRLGSARLTSALLGTAWRNTAGRGDVYRVMRRPRHNIILYYIRVGIATGYGLDDREVGVRVPVGSGIFTSPYRPDRLWGPPNLLYIGYQG
jgi:hypothetical protein